MLERLDFWLAIITLGALAWFELRLGRFVRPLLSLGEGLVERGREEIEERRRRRPMRLRPVRGAHGHFHGSLPAEIERNENEDHFGDVSGIAEPKDDTEIIAFHFLARLVKSGHVTETQALESACGVKAGSSKAYQEARSKLKKALEEAEIGVAAH
jgi:hypothetical protein